MKRLGRGIAGTAIIGTALAAALACGQQYQIPNGTCKPTSLVTPRLDGGASAINSCKTCYEGACCDAVGRCNDQLGCDLVVSGAQQCFLDKGIKAGTTASINECLDTVNQDDGGVTESAMKCMRESCHDECQVPYCVLDTSVILFTTRACDDCISQSCCPYINRCYGDRGCKLALECLVRECGADQALANEVLDEKLTSVEKLLCNNDPTGTLPEPGKLADGGPNCVGQCLKEFLYDDPAQGQPDSRGCLLWQVYECGHRAGCTTECAAP